MWGGCRDASPTSLPATSTGHVPPSTKPDNLYNGERLPAYSPLIVARSDLAEARRAPETLCFLGPSAPAAFTCHATACLLMCPTDVFDRWSPRLACRSPRFPNPVNIGTNFYAPSVLGFRCRFCGKGRGGTSKSRSMAPRCKICNAGAGRDAATAVLGIGDVCVPHYLSIFAGLHCFATLARMPSSTPENARSLQSQGNRFLANAMKHTNRCQED